jgi:hypothetical protein
MTATETASAERTSANDVSVDIEKPRESHVHQETSTAEKDAAYIPQSDEEYNVTLKTWIVVWVRASREACQNTIRLTQDLLVKNRFLPSLMESLSGSSPPSALARPASPHNSAT